MEESSRFGAMGVSAFMATMLPIVPQQYMFTTNLLTTNKILLDLRRRMSCLLFKWLIVLP